MTPWPASFDYTGVIQNPHVCFRDPELKSSQVDRNTLGMPSVWSGNLAQVHALQLGAKRWAVKCFTRSSPDIKRRYAAIASAVAAARLPFCVGFQFLDDEILVNGRRYPIVKMDWVSGTTLDAFVKTHLTDPSALVSIARQLLQAVHSMEACGIAHGDLQHGNIILTTQGLKLVDYDGIFVPAFRGQEAPELGLPGYQHPRRSARDYNARLDRFAVLVICTALVALANDQRLANLATGDNLLFTQNDFLDPTASPLFRRLTAAGVNADVCLLANKLATACGRKLHEIELLDLSSIPSSQRLGKSARAGVHSGSGTTSSTRAPGKPVPAWLQALVGSSVLTNSGSAVPPVVQVPITSGPQVSAATAAAGQQWAKGAFGVGLMLLLTALLVHLIPLPPPSVSETPAVARTDDGSPQTPGPPEPPNAISRAAPPTPPVSAAVPRLTPDPPAEPVAPPTTDVPNLNHERRERVVPKLIDPAVPHIDDVSRAEKAATVPVVPRRGAVEIQTFYGATVRVIGDDFDERRMIAPGSAQSKFQLPPGRYQVLASAPEAFLRFGTSVTVREGMTEPVVLPARVSVRVYGVPGNCDLFIDGRKIVGPPFDGEIVTGLHEFRFLWPTASRQFSLEITEPSSIGMGFSQDWTGPTITRRR